MEPNTPSPFRTLGVDEDATAGDVRQAFLSLAKRTHPDTGGDSAEFRRLYEAYQVARTQARPGPTRRPKGAPRPYAWFVEGPWFESPPLQPAATGAGRPGSATADPGRPSFTSLLDQELARAGVTG